jgi:hypothetical protein
MSPDSDPNYQILALTEFWPVLPESRLPISVAVAKIQPVPSNFSNWIPKFGYLLTVDSDYQQTPMPSGCGFLQTCVQ